jgi:hypothetical protein
VKDLNGLGSGEGRESRGMFDVTREIIAKTALEDLAELKEVAIGRRDHQVISQRQAARGLAMPCAF